MKISWILKVTFATFLIVISSGRHFAQAGTVTVITSFPKELTQIYKTEFEKANPDIKIEILNKNTI